jgi:hypothetical protein
MRGGWLRHIPIPCSDNLQHTAIRVVHVAVAAPGKIRQRPRTTRIPGIFSFGRTALITITVERPKFIKREMVRYQAVSL